VCRLCRLLRDFVRSIAQPALGDAIQRRGCRLRVELLARCRNLAPSALLSPSAKATRRASIPLRTMRLFISDAEPGGTGGLLSRKRPCYHHDARSIGALTISLQSSPRARFRRRSSTVSVAGPRSKRHGVLLSSPLVTNRQRAAKAPGVTRTGSFSSSSAARAVVTGRLIVERLAICRWCVRSGRVCAAHALSCSLSPPFAYAQTAKHASLWRRHLYAAILFVKSRRSAL
jgi:hypothetical protein